MTITAEGGPELIEGLARQYDGVSGSRRTTGTDRVRVVVRMTPDKVVDARSLAPSDLVDAHTRPLGWAGDAAPV